MSLHITTHHTLWTKGLTLRSPPVPACKGGGLGQSWLESVSCRRLQVHAAWEPQLYGTTWHLLKQRQGDNGHSNSTWEWGGGWATLRLQLGGVSEPVF